MNGARVHLLTFATGRKCWTRAAERLSRQASLFQEISSVTLVNRETLPRHIGGLASEVSTLSKSHPRGYGLWSWKIPLLESAIRGIPEGDILFYIDAGSSLNFQSLSIPRWGDYLSSVLDTGALFFQQDLAEEQWTKTELKQRFKDEGDWKSGQVLGGIHMIQSSQSSRDFLMEAKDLACQHNFSFLKDSDSPSIQGQNFRAHRHDQSVLSLLAKERQLLMIPDETYFSPDWARQGERFPIWATRLCSGNPSVTNSLFNRSRRFAERSLPF